MKTPLIKLLWDRVFHFKNVGDKLYSTVGIDNPARGWEIFATLEHWAERHVREYYNDELEKADYNITFSDMKKINPRIRLWHGLGMFFYRFFNFYVWIFYRPYDKNVGNYDD